MAANSPQTPDMTIIDAFWDVYVGNLNFGHWSEVTMPIGLKSVIGQDGINIMAARFSNLIEAPVKVTEDLEQGSVKITPSCNRLGQDKIIPGAQKAKPRTSTKAKVARPPNAFILYRQHHHPLVRSEYPELHNNQISVILGTQWKQESNENKAQYVALASRLKAKHLQQNPGYQYQPRKPSEKKRRMSRRRNASKTITEISSLPNSEEEVDPKQVVSSASTTVESPGSSSAGSVGPTTASAPTPTDQLTISNDASGDNLAFEKTIGGNTVFDLGDENMEDDHFAAMLMQYNESVPAAPNHVAAVALQNVTPVLYHERPEDAQNDANFYSSMIEFDAFISSPMDFNDYFDFKAAAMPSPTT